MYEYVTIKNFIERMNEKDANHFTGSGLVELYKWLSAFDENLGNEHAPMGKRFDPVQICSDYTEYKNLKDYQEQNNSELTLKELEQKTGVIELPNSKGFILENNFR
tara:strand:- start:390 stop:707 length:318 start_codon:yes stop_codon:yes gene_type:complete